MSQNPIEAQIPKEISTFFSETDFANYPILVIPQFFLDERGTISNIADGDLGDVAVITSKRDSIRANHVHAEDWHLSYLVYGQMNYSWRDLNGINQSRIVNSGELVFTPKNVPHRMQFKEDSCFIAISKLSRMTEKYELDTLRLDSNYFNDIN
jgi:quercetin dioxygenase-like cupin family protein